MFLLFIINVFMACIYDKHRTSASRQTQSSTFLYGSLFNFFLPIVSVFLFSGYLDPLPLMAALRKAKVQPAAISSLVKILFSSSWELRAIMSAVSRATSLLGSMCRMYMHIAFNVTDTIETLQLEYNKQQIKPVNFLLSLGMFLVSSSCQQFPWWQSDVK